jgi:hypothetical protein
MALAQKGVKKGGHPPVQKQCQAFGGGNEVGFEAIGLGGGPQALGNGLGRLPGVGLGLLS